MGVAKAAFKFLLELKITLDYTKVFIDHATKALQTITQE